MSKRLVIAAALLALAAGSVLVACEQVASGSASNASAEAEQSSATPERASDVTFTTIDDRDDSLERAQEERKRQEAEERARQEHEAEWRAQFPTDDYSNTILIGDSIMQQAGNSLYETLPNVAINADSGRTLEYGGAVYEGKSPNCGVLDHVRRDEGLYDRYVIGTGNNEVGGMPIEAAQEIVDCLGPDKQIYFVTMCSTVNQYGTEVTNASIDAMVEQYDNVHKIDWYGFVNGRETEYLRDGIHVYYGLEPEYAAFIKEGLDVVY